MVLDIKPVHEQINMIKPDDDMDFHTYRILLLLLVCGNKYGISEDKVLIYGRTKFAFYDFLIRYPAYLEKLINVIKKNNGNQLLKEIGITDEERAFIFSPMVTYVRGPWDKRYDSIFNYMISKGLISIKYYKITKKGSKKFCIILSDLGFTIAKIIEEKELDWVSRMKVINTLFPKKTTNERIESIIANNFIELILG